MYWVVFESRVDIFTAWGHYNHILYNNHYITAWGSVHNGNVLILRKTSSFSQGWVHFNKSVAQRPTMAMVTAVLLVHLQFFGASISAVMPFIILVWFPSCEKHGNYFLPKPVAERRKPHIPFKKTILLGATLAFSWGPTCWEKRPGP